MEINQITEAVIGCAIRVSNELGVGFLEKVYENALVYELRMAGIKAEPQQPLKVFYDGMLVGEYWADLVVEDVVIIELKSAKGIDPAHEAQMLNYLKATGLTVGLILNFGTCRLGVKRMIR